ncbi:NUDIX hydrolase [Streptomyces rishiriensis]|uniref:8-oxo-dGTP pyrophosphatase MutT (NUDIX family)/predicted kinase n=1 Tax=Streptomyces rishiriensis TaxID=68264 RepID=A0ABU0NJJ7_STRRH|nr:NUDIX hydrolase [Streptomyces rishiriensis]MDQ0579288.1 8-oxo-dGTP pyrophosphatase MutT (NUDIX family)/predicted kinase [Streptomyces rishiriensis]
MTVVWINGAFGAGKTTTARELIDLIPNSTLFDPEVIGGALPHLLPPKRLAEAGDFQDLPIWRRLVIDTAAALLAELGGTLVVPMTLLRQEYRDEIFGGLAARRIPVRHVLLAPGETILRERIAAREVPPDLPDGEIRIRQWSYDHIEPYHAALASWLTADAHPVDNGVLTPRETAARIAEAVGSGAVAACEIVQTPEPTAETVAAGVLLFDERDRVLLVDPTYKPGWEFPGGVVEPGEAPARAGVREVEEETGIRLDDAPRLLVVDWERPRPPAYGGLRLLFDGGRLDPAAVAGLLLPGPELRAWRFVTEEEAADLLPPVRYERLRWALRARERGAALYLEAGVPTE